MHMQSPYYNHDNVHISTALSAEVVSFQTYNETLVKNHNVFFYLKNVYLVPLVMVTHQNFT